MGWKKFETLLLIYGPRGARLSVKKIENSPLLPLQQHIPPSLLQKKSVIFPTTRQRRRRAAPALFSFHMQISRVAFEKSSQPTLPHTRNSSNGRRGGGEDIDTCAPWLVYTRDTCVDSDDRFLLRNIALVINGNFFF